METLRDSAWSVVPMKEHGLNTIEFLRDFFKNGPDCDNWCLLSTSGVHGSYCTLDDCKIESDRDNRGLEPGYRWITVLIVSPRVLRMHYGNIVYSMEKDEAWLRNLVQCSMNYIVVSQHGNFPPGSPYVDL